MGDTGKKLLITGFEPFGGEPLNSSWEAVQKLPEQIRSYRLTKLRIPTVFGRGSEAVLRAADELSPDVILCVGQAGNRAAVTPEVIGINLRESRIADNDGNRPGNVPVCGEGPAAYFATVPVREMAAAVRKAGIESALSFSAGAYVCNDVFYTLLHRFHGTGTRVGFIHVPPAAEQAKEGRVCLPLEDIVKALTEAVGALG